MKTVAIFFVLCIAGILAFPQSVYKVIPVLQRTEVHDDAGQFSVSYLSGDGTTVSEQGLLKATPDGEDYVLVKQGSYSFTSPEGQVFTVKYVADEGGFRPEAAHLPVAPKA